MDWKKLIHIIAVVIILGIAILAAINQNWIIALIAIIAFGFFAWGFIAPFFNLGNGERPKKTMEELIGIAMRELERVFKITVDRQGSFQIFDNQIEGEWWKFVFARRKEGIVNYYFATVNIYTGEIGERTGVTTNRINEVSWFLHKDGATSAPPEYLPTNEAIAQMKAEVLGDLEKSNAQKEGSE